MDVAPTRRSNAWRAGSRTAVGGTTLRSSRAPWVYNAHATLRAAYQRTGGGSAAWRRAAQLLSGFRRLPLAHKHLALRAPPAAMPPLLPPAGGAITLCCARAAWLQP